MRLPRRRGFSSLALLSAGALLFSSTYGGLAALASGARGALAQAGRRPAGPFTQAPTRAFLDLRPGRDPKGRGGMWSPALRGALAETAFTERLWAAVGPFQTGATKTVAYLATDEVASVTDELGHTTTNAYDDAGRQTSVTNPRGDVESYGYDNADRRTTVTNGRGKVRTYAFTNRGDVSSLTMPDGAVESWSYDGAGNATAYVNPLSQTILYGFDDAGRQTLVDYPTGTDTTFGYDNADRRISMVDGTGTTTWAYDNADRETTFSAPQGAQTSGYDDAGRRTSLTGTGIARAWTYDDAGRVLSLSNESSETTAYAYDGAGRLSTTTLANGQVSVMGYDARSRQTSVLHKASAMGSTISSESYVYDDAGNLASKNVDGTTTSYGYDNVDQLTAESRTGYSAGYTYDANGNRTGKTLNGVTDTYAVDDGDKLTAITQGATTAKSYTYDAAGRTTGVTSSAGTTTLNYDYESRVASISGPGVSNSFTYNGLDTRVGKVDSGGTKAFRRDGAGVTAPVLSDGAAVYTPGVSQRRAGSTTFDLGDRLGSASKQTNSSASTTATRTYDAFGILVSSTGTPQGPFGFASGHGYQEDGDSGLKLLGHRYYDASTGRFLTRDPIKDGRNWYGYCGNNPLKWVDPEGLIWHNPSQIHVDPRFGGSVIAIGEPGPGQSQVAVGVRPGQSTHPQMDVDLIMIRKPDGSVTWWFISGSRKDKSGIGDDYYIDKDGDVHGPWNSVNLTFDPSAPFLPETSWRDDIDAAMGKVPPKNRLPIRTPAWPAGKNPFDSWR